MSLFVKGVRQSGDNAQSQKAAVALLAFQKPHQRPQHPVLRSLESQTLPAPEDQSIEVVDLAALAAAPKGLVLSHRSRIPH